MSFPHRCASAVTTLVYCAEHYSSPLAVTQWCDLRLCPQPDRSHAFLSADRRQQVLLVQEPQGEVDQQPSDGLQLLPGLLGVRVAEALLAGVLLHLPHVVDRVVRQAFEDLLLTGQRKQRRGKKT